MGNSILFNYIKVKQIAEIESLHPIVYNLSTESKHNPHSIIDILLRCPDTYDDYIFYYYLVKNDSIVASIRTIPDVLTCKDNKKYKWSWGGGFFTEPEFRGQGLGFLLWQNTMRVHLECNVILAGAFVNPSVTRMSDKLNFTIPARAHRYVLLKSCMPILKNYSRFIKINKIIDSVFTYCIKKVIYRNCSLSRFNIDIEVLNINDYEDENWKLFNSTMNQNKYNFNHTMDKIRWKLVNAKDCKTYFVFDKVTHSPLFYIILRNRYITHKLADKFDNFNLMTLMDYGFFSNSSALIKLFIKVITHYFMNSSADVLEVITSKKELIDKLPRHYFLKAGDGISFFFKQTGCMRLPEDCEEILNWQVTHYTSDAFMFK